MSPPRNLYEIKLSSPLTFLMNYLADLSFKETLKGVGVSLVESSNSRS